MLIKKKKDVLVNVKTVTIIESISDSGNKEYPPVTTSSTSKGTDPYIKIQLPSSKVSKSITTQTSTTNNEIKAQKKTDGEKKHYQPIISTTVPKGKEETTPKTTSSIISSSAKAKPMFSTVTSISSQSVSKSVTPIKKASTHAKEDAFAKSTSVKAVVTSKKNTTNDSGSLGSIFNVLKGMPFGGKDNESLYVEGTFKFPKKKDLKNQTFKMSGYVSSA